jgi:hypothetical protein
MSDTKERFFSSQFEAIVTELSRLASDCDIDVEQDEFGDRVIRLIHD